MQKNYPFAAIFDWDGVIIDSSAQHKKSFELLAQEAGYTLRPGDFERSFGIKNNYTIPKIFKWTQDLEEIERLGHRKEELYREILAVDGIEVLPGVRELLEDLKAHGVPCAIGSSSPLQNLELTIDRLNLHGYFCEIACAEDVIHSKPAPDVFLAAARKLGVEPARSIVFEDAHAGIEAGLAAGMRVVGVATTHEPHTLEGAHRVVHRLTELNFAELDRWMRAAPVLA
ncbi:MAG: hypothetical protein B7X06_01840 [Verrucomicrobia bacterium 21-51-4]|nr:MAG: hypothetical protein B7X06_01840 [Verrucomicrobia bacterium 21-51-4]HQU09150.1 HAD family phosphatase [Opitutales bacterium]